MSDLREKRGAFFVRGVDNAVTRAYVEALEAEVERLTKERDAAREAGKDARLREKAAEDRRIAALARIPDPDDLRLAVTACELVADDLHSVSGGRSENIAPWRERAARLRATLGAAPE